MNKFILKCVILLLLFSFVNVKGDELPEGTRFYVNNKTGSDDFTGLAANPGENKAGPFRTITQAVTRCAVGARIEIANTGTDYRESVSIEGYRKGRAESPLIINGNGAYVTGLVEVAKDQWFLLKDDIYYFPNKVGGTDLKPRAWYERKIGDAVYGIMPNSNWLDSRKHQGWFTEKDAPEIFLLNGKPGPNVLKLDDLQPGGFFYDTQSETVKELTGQRCLFFRLPEGKKLADCVVELPLNKGVYVSDDYVTICNIGSRYSQDDGFAGFWGQGVVLRNIHACFNCDQGVSFHGNSTTLIDGALIERNAGCGIVDVMSCTTVYRNVTVRENYPAGAIFSGFAHAMYNSRIMDNSGMQVEFSKGASGSLVNCLIVGRGAKTAGVSMENGRIERCTILDSSTGVRLIKGGSIKNSIISNCTTILDVGKLASESILVDKTILGLGEVVFDGKKINQEAWPEFAKTAKGLSGAIIDTPTLEGSLCLLPKDSPHIKAGENGVTPGANLPPDTNWKTHESK
jgi:hypothetical protein